MLALRGLAARELHELDLVELVLANHAARVPSRGARFGAKARCVRTIGDGEVGLREDLVPVEVRDRHLGRGRQEPVRPLEAEEILLELRELARAEQGRGVHEERGQDLRVAVLTRVHVQEELDEGAGEERRPSLQHREAGTGDLGRALEVENAERGTKVPVRLRREVETRRLAPRLQDDVLGFVGSLGNGSVRNVGQRLLDGRESQVESLQRFFE